MRRRRIILAAVLLALLVGIVAIVWEVNNWPPPRLVVKPLTMPKGGPTGRTFTDPSGIEFLEIAAGGSWFRREDKTFELPLWHRFLPFIDSSRFIGIRTRISSDWVDVGSTYWISREKIPHEIMHGEWKQAERVDPSCGFAEDFCFFDRKACLDWFISRLAGRTGGRYRIPTRQEVLLSHATGGLKDTKDSIEIALSEEGHEELWFRDAMFFTTSLPYSRSGYVSIFPDFRLVWIPPENE